MHSIDRPLTGLPGNAHQTGPKALAVSGVVAVGREPPTRLFEIRPENNLGWAIGAIAGAAASTTLMRGAKRT